jgi:peroxiredoxin
MKIQRISQLAGVVVLVTVLTMGSVGAIFPAWAEFPVSKPAPAFTLKTLEGRSLSLSQFKGKVVFLDFWMPGCPPCEAEAPYLQKLHKKYHGQGLRIIGVTQTDPPPEAVRAFIQRHKTTYPILMDRGMKVAGRYQLEAHPTGVLIDRKGVVRYVHSGFLIGEEKQIEASIRAVLSNRGVPKG